MMELKIGRHTVGPGHPCYLIAEIGVNHDGSEDKARELVSRAAACGVQAVKFQVFGAARLVTPSAGKADYQKTGGDTESQYEMLKRLELRWNAFRRLAKFCGTRGVDFLATPFSGKDLQFIISLDAPALKIGSGELTNTPLLEQAAASGKPVILSTGMATGTEVAAAVDVLQRPGGGSLALLHCVSNYPAADETVNLKAMQTLGREFGVPAGLSDHTLGDTAAVAATALGACVIEKHFTLDVNDPGPDHASSADPAQLAALVTAVRRTEAMLGSGKKEPAPSELPVRELVRKSLTAAEGLAAGTVLTADKISLKRPGTGIAPDCLDRVIGKKIVRTVAPDTTLTPDMIEDY